MAGLVLASTQGHVELAAQALILGLQFVGVSEGLGSRGRRWVAYLC
jgi:hypothetical protein